MAIKRMLRRDLTLTDAVRKEVMQVRCDYYFSHYIRDHGTLETWYIRDMVL